LKVKLTCEAYGGDGVTDHYCNSQCHIHIHTCCAFCKHRQGLECLHPDRVNANFTLCSKLKSQGALFLLLMEAGRLEVTKEKSTEE
jgi:hypothetical protein